MAETWEDLIFRNKQKVILISTATTGFKPEAGAKLIEVWAAIFTGNTVPRILQYQQQLSDEDLQQGQEYHCISLETNRTLGVSADIFKKQLQELFEESIVFSYNPRFQERFVEVTVEDLPKLLQLSKVMQDTLPDEWEFQDVINDLAKTSSNVAFSEIKGDRVAPPGSDPAYFNLMCVVEAFQQLLGKEIKRSDTVIPYSKYKPKISTSALAIRV